MDIDEQTKVPLFVIVGSIAFTLPLLVGMIMWLTTINEKASAAQNEIKGMRELVSDIRERVIRIEQWQRDKN